MARNVLKAKLDIIFKKLFTSDNEILTAFVEDILDLPRGAVKKVDVLNPNILPDRIDGKQGQLDLKMQVDDRIVNVEIQLRDEKNFRDRSLYYWSKIYSDELKSGDEYTNLKQTITVNILNFNLFDCKEYYSSFSVLEKNRYEVLSDKCSILFFELRKLNRTVEKDNRKKLWLQLIDAETEEELDMLEQTGVPEIQKAVVILHEMSADEELQEIARLREKWTHDEVSALANSRREGREEGRKEGIKEGIKEGRKEGIKEGKEEIIQKLRKSGMSEEQIKMILDLK